MPRMILFLSCLSMCLVTSCGQDKQGELSGSLQQFYDTSFERTRARLYSSELAIEYVREDGEVPVRISVRRGPHLKTDTSIDLIEFGSLTGRSRDTDMPLLSSGKVTFERLDFEDGEMVVGEFDASFSVGRDTASLSGSFETSLEDVETVSGYEWDFGSDMGDMPDTSGNM